MRRRRSTATSTYRRVPASAPASVRTKRSPLANHWAARLAEEKHAQQITVLDMRQVSGVTDYFVICNGDSARQVQAIADHISDGARERSRRVWHMEGYQDAQWVLLDCGDVVVHVFHPAARVFYGLEQLWGDVPRATL